MKLERMFTLIAILALVCSMPAMAAKSKDLDPADYQTEEAIAEGAKKLLKQTGLKRIRKGDPKTVAITQFSVEYITSKKQLTGAGNQIKSGKFGLGALVTKGVEAAGVGEKRYDLEEEFKESLPDYLYSELVTSLKNQGFNVLTLEEVRDSEAYAKFKTKDEGDVKKEKRGKKFSGGGSTVTKVDRRSANGLVEMKAGVMSGIKNARAEAQLMHDLGADISMRVDVRLGVYNKGRPSIEPGSIIHVTSGYSEAKMPSGNIVYNPQMQGNVAVKKQLLYAMDVVDDGDFDFGKGKIFKVNSDKFTEAMHAMFPVYAAMAVSTMD